MPDITAIEAAAARLHGHALRTPLLARLPLLLLGTQFLVLTLCLCAYPVTCEAKNGNECQCENLFHNAKRFCIMKLQNPCLKSQFL